MWYLHVMYKVRSKKQKRQKRSTLGHDDEDENDETYHQMSVTSTDFSMVTRNRRSDDALREIRSIGRKKGTNLKMLNLRTPKVQYVFKREDTRRDEIRNNKTNLPLTCGLVGGFIVLLLVVVGMVVYRKCFAGKPVDKGIAL